MVDAEALPGQCKKKELATIELYIERCFYYKLARDQKRYLRPYARF